MSFDGTNDYVSVGQSQVFRQQNFTIEAWIKPYYDIMLGSDSTYGHEWGSIVNCRVIGGTSGWFLGFNYRTGQLHFIIDSQWVNFHSNKAVWYNNAWYHIALSFDQRLPSGNLRFYMNGALDSQHDDQGSVAYGDTTLQIGSQSSAGHFFGGLLDEVRIWNISRGQIEIQGTMLRILSSTETASSNLIGYWRFDEGTGAVSQDYSRYTNDAVLAPSPANPQRVSTGSPITYELSTFQLTIEPTADGTTDPIPGNYAIVVGTVASVRAVPSTGYILSYWKLDGANIGSMNPTTIAMNSNHTLQAVFSVVATPNGLVGYWKFDEGTGNTAADSSGKGNTATLHNGPTWIDGKSGKALGFNGVSNYVKIPDNIIRSNVTLSVSLWFVTAAYGVIIGYQNTEYPSDPYYYVPIIYVGTDGRLRGEFWTGTNSPITTTSNVNDNSWHHVALIGNTNTQSLYLDGDLVGTLAGAIEHLDMSKNYIGLSKWDRWPSSSGIWGFFNGKIDEVQIYHRLLDQQEIRETKRARVYLRFDEGAGNTATDSSGNGNTATLYNGPSWVDSTHGKALSFDGVDDYASFSPLNSPIYDLTVMAWINSPLNKIGLVIYHGNTGEFQLGNGHPKTGNDPQRILFGVKLEDGNWYYAASSPLTANSWHHVAGVWSKGIYLKVYVDGTLAANVSVPNDDIFDPGSGYLPTIGAYNRGSRPGDMPSQFFAGTIDEIRIYDKALSQQEILTDMGSVTSPTDGTWREFTLPWSLSTILMGTMSLATVGIGGLATVRLYKHRKLSKLKTTSRKIDGAEKEVAEGNLVKAAQYYSEAILASLKQTSKMPKDTVEQYSEAIRGAIYQQAFKGDKKSLDILHDIQRKVRSNKLTLSTDRWAHVFSRIETLLDVARKGYMDNVVDAALQDEAFQKSLLDLNSSLLDTENELLVSDIAKQSGYCEQATETLLSKGIEQHKIKGRLASNKKVFYSKKHLTRYLTEDLSKYLNDARHG